MSAPERIWAWEQPGGLGSVRGWTDRQVRATEYIRADLAPAAPKVKALVEAAADCLFWKAKCDADDHENAMQTVLIEGHMEDAMDALRAALAALEGGDA